MGRMKKIIIGIAALGLFLSPAIAEEGHEGHGTHPAKADTQEHKGHHPEGGMVHVHDVEVIPETKIGVNQKLLAEFRNKKADLDKKNGWFLDQKGNKVTLDTYKGKLILLDFIYSGCKHGICQYMNKKMDFVAQKHRDKLGKDLVLVSVSFDAEDTPKTLMAFAQNWESDPSKWAYLSGLPGDIAETTRRFGVAFRWNEKEQFFEHTVRTILLDREGKPVKVYRGHDYKMQEAVDDIANLLAGKPLTTPQ